MENNYAPSNETLLILATRTGKRWWHRWTQIHTGLRKMAPNKEVFWTFANLQCKSWLDEINWNLSWCILHMCSISYIIASINQCNHRWVRDLIWLKMVTLAPSPSSHLTVIIYSLLSFIKWVPVFFSIYYSLWSAPFLIGKIYIHNTWQLAFSDICLPWGNLHCFYQ